jgi:hypothetical protein
VFKKAIPMLKNRTLPHIPQTGEGTFHAKGDIERIQNLDACTDPAMAERIVRGLTTNDPREAAYRTVNGKKNPVRFEPHA